MSARLSPGGALLRSSRMFSIPKPLPKVLGNSGHDHATAPYPTHQSITTFEDSRKRGDWGLKRPLPLKTTGSTSTPAIRVKHIDSVERLTDFVSSSEHTLTLQKFQELKLPLTVPVLSRTYRGQSTEGLSIFEEDLDTIATPLGLGAGNNDKRWKFKGPWLAGLSEGEFEQYVRKNVRNRRHEFREFLRKRLASNMTTNAQQEALEKAEDSPTPIQANDITQEQFVEYLRKLRSDRVTLYAMVGEFLDLAPLNPPSAVTSMSAGARVQAKSPNPYADRGPPKTHPSAGLSYLRTAAHAENHPLYGPQAQPSPVLAKVVAPRMLSNSAKLGVAGFITETPQGDSAFNTKNHRLGKTRIPGIALFDPEIKGGAKCYVEPRSANVDSSGRIIIKVDESSEEAQLIAKELVGTGEIYNSKPAEPESARTLLQRTVISSNRYPKGRREGRGLPSQTNGSAATYGLA